MEELDCGEALEAVAFVGETLGPLFFHDPQDGATDDVLAAFAAADPAALAEEWPFAPRQEAEPALRAMVSGAQGGADEDLVWEYRRLFVGPGPKAAPPWGSVYTDRECVVFGERTLALRQWMRQKGVERLTDEAEPEDHIGSMLLLMAWLARHRPELLDEFMAEHFLPWSSHLLALMGEATRHPFYQGLAQLALESLEGIGAVRRLEVEVPRFYR